MDLRNDDGDPSLLAGMDARDVDGDTSLLAEILQQNQSLFPGAEDHTLDLQVYEYRPIDHTRQIRVLYIDSSSDEDAPVNCKLVPIDIDSAKLPKYTTISYSWGITYTNSSHLTEYIICDGQLMCVTANILAALKRIRGLRADNQSAICPWDSISPRDRYLFISPSVDNVQKSRKIARSGLWLDSICIDQSNLVEKSAQVARMARIYSRSSSMIVWLGEFSKTATDWIEDIYTELGDRVAESPSLFMLKDASPSEKLKVLLASYDLPWRQEVATLASLMSNDRLKRLSQVTSEETSAAARLSCQGVRRLAFLEDHQSKGSTSIDRQSFTEAYQCLSARPWFQRKWTVQEVATTSSKERYLLIGDWIIQWRAMLERFDRHSLDNAAEHLQGKVRDHSLLQNLFRYDYTECSLPQDHVYSLIGMSNDCGWLTVDYNAEVSDIYTALAWQYVCCGQLISVLALATMHSGHDLPSWVPDWRSPRKADRSRLHNETVTMIHHLLETPLQCAGPRQKDLSSVRQIGFELLGWLVPACGIASSHDEAACRKCQMLNMQSQADAAAAEPKDKGKQPVRESSGGLVSGTKTGNLLQMRRRVAKEKYGSLIEEQFNVTMDPGEVLLFLENSPLCFVLRQTEAQGVNPTLSVAATYRVQFCFQVDEARWMTNWATEGLGESSLETVMLV